MMASLPSHGGSRLRSDNCDPEIASAFQRFAFFKQAEKRTNHTMLRIRTIFAVVAAAFAASGLLWPNRANADFEVAITTGAGTTIIHDGGAGDLDMTVNNQISFNYHDAFYNVIGSLAITNSPGNPSLALLDINYTISAINLLGGPNGLGGAGSLSASATGFTQPTTNPLTLHSGINGNGTGTGTLTMNQFADPGNAEFGTGVAAPPLGPFNIGQAGGYNGSSSVLFNQTGAYSITDVLNFNLTSGSATTGDSASLVTPAPAPAGLLLALAGIPALGVGAMLRRRRVAQAAH
jgi:hypothetical protein